MQSLEFKDLCTTEINVYELVVGTELKNEKKSEELQKILSMLSRIKVFPIDRKSSIKAGSISGNLRKKGNIIGDNDCLVAGTALANGVTTIVTRNKKHFERITEIKVMSY